MDENAQMTMVKVKVTYSQTCIKRSHLGRRKNGLIKRVTL